MKSLQECDYDFQKLVMKMEAKAENLSQTEDARPHCCENCGRQFSTSAYLSQHRRIHSGVKPYVCRFCDRKFTQLSHVQQHERIHTGEKPYSCVTCMKSFTQMSNLHSHQRQHMKNKPCKCSNCFMAFDMQQDLENHIESKHTSERYRKILICPVCSKMYNSETYLTKHVERHDESSSKSSDSSHKSLLNCEPASKYRRQSKAGSRSFFMGSSDTSMVPATVSQSFGFTVCNSDMKEPLAVAARSVSDMSMALDISKSIVTAASGLRLDVFLEGLASSNCPSPLVSAAASVWGQSWFPSSTNQILDINHHPMKSVQKPTNQILDRNHHQMKSVQKPTNHAMCLDLVSLHKQSKVTQPPLSLMMGDVALSRDSSVSSTSTTTQPSPITLLPTLSNISDKYAPFSEVPSNSAPHINNNTITTTTKDSLINSVFP